MKAHAEQKVGRLTQKQRKELRSLSSSWGKNMQGKGVADKQQRPRNISPSICDLMAKDLTTVSAYIVPELVIQAFPATNTVHTHTHHIRPCIWRLLCHKTSHVGLVCKEGFLAWEGFQDMWVWDNKTYRHRSKIVHVKTQSVTSLQKKC